MKIQNLLYRTLFFSALLLNTACSKYLYVPNSVNVPMLHEKGDVRVVANYSQGDGFSNKRQQSEFQVAHAVSHNTAVLFNAMHYSGQGTWTFNGTSTIFGTPTPVTPNTLAIGKGSLAEFGAGQFYNLYTDGKKGIVNEWYGGMGLGNISLEERTDELLKIAFLKSNYSRVFAQTSIGFRTKNMEIAYAPRLSWMHYSLIQTNLSTKDLDFKDPNSFPSNETHLNIIDNPNLLFIDQGIVFRIGKGNFQFQAQLISSTRRQAVEIEHKSFSTSFGISYRFNGDDYFYMPKD
jgi:hypothetical protein